jgi:HNH endonuclease
MKRPRHPWTSRELALLRKMYPDMYGQDIARQLGHPVHSVYGKAAKLGLHKSVAFYARNYVDEGNRLRRVGCAHRFQKGVVAANKGLRRPGWHAGRMQETQFKKGNFPFNRDPDFYVLGALRVNSDGYIDMRTSFAAGSRGWRPLHTLLWEDAHGPVPPGYCLIFRNREPLDVELDNLELITRAENMRRNSIHNVPEPLRAAIQQLGQLKRRINRENRGRPA